MLECRCAPHLLNIMVKRVCFADEQEEQEAPENPELDPEGAEEEEAEEDKENKETMRLVYDALETIRAWARAMTGEVLHDWFRGRHGGVHEKSLHLDASADWLSTEEMIRRVGLRPNNETWA